MLYILLCSECDPPQGFFWLIGDNIVIILQALSLLAIIVQLFFIYRTNKADNDRKKKQATIDTLMTILKDYKITKDNLGKKFPGSDPVKLEDIYDEHEKEIRNYLSIIEYFCVGLNIGIYDFDMFNRMAGGYFVFVFDKLEPFIKHSQSTQLTAYIEFQVVCTKIRSQRPQLEEDMSALSEKSDSKTIS